MKSTYSVAASYRYRVDPDTGEVSPLAVWSPLALRDRIVEAEISATIPSSDGPSSDGPSSDGSDGSHGDSSHSDSSLGGSAPASASSSAAARADSVTPEPDDAGDVDPGDRP
jgi:hypothetical protein